VNEFPPRNGYCSTELTPGQSETGAAMWDDIWTLFVGTVFIPIIVVFGLFRLAASRRAKDLPRPQANEWAASQDLRKPT
jgi:hypothetical protein